MEGLTIIIIHSRTKGNQNQEKEGGYILENGNELKGRNTCGANERFIWWGNLGCEADKKGKTSTSKKRQW